VKIETICGMTCYIDHLYPKLVRSLVLIKHGSCHLYESFNLSFGHLILLCSVGGQKLMFDAFFIKIVFYLSVLELGVIIASNSLDFSIKFILRSLLKFL
jgi:hypothetical protein